MFQASTEFGAESSGRNFRLCTVRRGAADSPIFLWLGVTQQLHHVLPLRPSQDVCSGTSMRDMPAILGRGVESIVAHPRFGGRAIIEIALAGAPIFLHWQNGSQQLYLRQSFNLNFSRKLRALLFKSREIRRSG
jgi:hypothetical protein